MRTKAKVRRLLNRPKKRKKVTPPVVADSWDQAMAVRRLKYKPPTMGIELAKAGITRAVGRRNYE